MGVKEQNPHNKQALSYVSATHKATEDKWWQPAIIMFVRLSAWIVAPVLLATVIGKWLDSQMDSAPWGLIGIVGISFIISMAGLIIETTKEYKNIEKNSRRQTVDDRK